MTHTGPTLPAYRLATDALRLEAGFTGLNVLVTLTSIRLERSKASPYKQRREDQVVFSPILFMYLRFKTRQ